MFVLHFSCGQDCPCSCLLSRPPRSAVRLRNKVREQVVFGFTAANHEAMIGM
jgi:hypothetical protein